jgi:hypothetical protein
MCAGRKSRNCVSTTPSGTKGPGTNVPVMPAAERRLELQLHRFGEARLARDVHRDEAARRIDLGEGHDGDVEGRPAQGQRRRQPAGDGDGEVGTRVVHVEAVLVERRLQHDRGDERGVRGDSNREPHDPAHVRRIVRVAERVVAGNEDFGLHPCLVGTHAADGGEIEDVEQAVALERPRMDHPDFRGHGVAGTPEPLARGDLDPGVLFSVLRRALGAADAVAVPRSAGREQQRGGQADGGASEDEPAERHAGSEQDSKRAHRRPLQQPP